MDLNVSKLIIFLCLTISVCATAGCASLSPTDRKMAAFSAWRSDVAARKVRVELSRIDELKKLNSLLSKEPVSAADIAAMRWASSDITTLGAMQAGKIGRSEAESVLRQSETTWRAESGARNAAAKPVNIRCVTWQGFTQRAT